MSKIKGTVKWFSNRKGFGFIAPTSDNSPTKEEIFVHQTSIFSDGDYRTLAEGTEVEFEVEKEADTGKLKAINVTAPGGVAIKPPPRERKRRPLKGRSSGGGGGAAASSGDEAAAPSDEKKNGGGVGKKEGGKPSSAPPGREPPFHDIIGADAKAKITDKGVDLGRKMTIDVALGDARIKLGQGGYAGLALASAVVGEGTYTCDESGLVNFTWERCLEVKDGKWTPGDAGKLLKSFSLANDNVSPVKSDETAESLWGADKGDPKDALAENGFKMKRIVLTRPPGGIRPRGRRHGGGGGGGRDKKKSSE